PGRRSRGLPGPGEAAGLGLEVAAYLVGEVVNLLLGLCQLGLGLGGPLSRPALGPAWLAPAARDPRCPAEKPHDPVLLVTNQACAALRPDLRVQICAAGILATRAGPFHVPAVPCATRVARVSRPVTISRSVTRPLSVPSARPGFFLVGGR